MAINMSSLESTLQSKFNAVTDPKEMLLLGKAYEATVGGITVTDVEDAGAAQVASINSVATSTFKTVGGSSILGSGDIATLPSGGSAGQVLKKDGSNNASWGTDEGGKLLNVSYFSYSGRVNLPSASSYALWTEAINKLSATSKLYVDVKLSMRGNHCDVTTWEMYAGNGGWTQAPMAYDAGFSANSRPMNTSFQLSTTSTGAITMSLRWRDHANGSCKPAVTWNPNTSDDGRNPQEISTLTVWEVET